MVLETHTGLYLDYCNPKANQISLEDVAHALAYTCRYGGHCLRYFSVAEHACVVATLVSGRDPSPELAFAALHHDDHEAYTGDIPSPLKAMLPEIKGLSARIDQAIGKAFDIDPELFSHPVVKAADALALRIEAQELKTSRGLGPYWNQFELVPGYEGIVECLSPEDAKSDFLYLHENRP